MLCSEPDFPSSMLKSALQKSIRRRKLAESLRIACLAMQRDVQDLIRRLSIIILEDSLLHPGISLVFSYYYL